MTFGHKKRPPWGWSEIFKKLMIKSSFAFYYIKRIKRKRTSVKFNVLILLKISCLKFLLKIKFEKTIVLGILY